jgi:hypothetical protein
LRKNIESLEKAIEGIPSNEVVIMGTPWSETRKPSGLRLILFMGALVAAGIAHSLAFCGEHHAFDGTQDLFSEKRTSHGELKKGAYVMLNIRSKYVGHGTPYLVIKRIACTGGEVLNTVGRSFYCNGREIAVAKDLSLKGEDLPLFPLHG